MNVEPGRQQVGVQVRLEGRRRGRRFRRIGGRRRLRQAHERAAGFGPRLGAAVENPDIRMAQHGEQPDRTRGAFAGFVVVDDDRRVRLHAARTEQRAEDGQKRVQRRLGGIVQTDAVEV